MNEETRAAHDRIRAFLACLSFAGDTIVTLTALAPPGEPIPLKASDLRLLLAALDQRPVMHAISGLCTWKTCGHAERAEVYRMTGDCLNCHDGPFLMLFTVGHETQALKCPRCGVDKVIPNRIATADEIGTSNQQTSDESDPKDTP